MTSLIQTAGDKMAAPTLATHSTLVHEVIHTDCWPQNGSTHGRVFANFKRRVLTDKTRNCVKKTTPAMCIIIIIIIIIITII